MSRVYRVGSVLLFVVLWIGMIHCAPQQNCIPGKSESCTCPGGTPSSQVCNTAGTGYEPCVCENNKSERPADKEAQGPEPSTPDEPTQQGPDEISKEPVAPDEKTQGSEPPPETGPDAGPPEPQNEPDPDAPPDQSPPDLPPDQSPEQSPDQGNRCGSYTLCNGLCVDTQSNAAHCGGCQQSCDARTQGCSQGKCIAKAGWAAQASGRDRERGYGIAVDPFGNTYVVGDFNSSSSTFGKTSLQPKGLSDIFIAKLDYKGTFLWVKQFSSPEILSGRSIAVGPKQEIYVTGSYNGVTQFGTITKTATAATGFVARLDPTGTVLWVKDFGSGTSGSFVHSVATNAQGEPVIAGSFSGMATFGQNVLVSAGGNDIFVAALSSTGSWKWASRAGGTLGDIAYSVAVQTSGAVVVAGMFNGTAKFGPIALTHNNPTAFVAGLGANGSWQWAKSVQGDGQHEARAVGTDPSGNVYVAGTIGQFASQKTAIKFGTITITTSSKESDGFLAKLDIKGNWLWAKGIGSCTKTIGCAQESVTALAVDDKGTAYITGFAGSGIELGSTQLSKANGPLFVARFNSNGDVLWAKQGSGSPESFGIAVDHQYSTFVTGVFKYAVLGGTTLQATGNLDLFVWKIP